MHQSRWGPPGPNLRIILVVSSYDQRVTPGTVMEFMPRRLSYLLPGSHEMLEDVSTGDGSRLGELRQENCYTFDCQLWAIK